ncbi:MAG: iron-sulfur cluster assembly protein [Candidatus Entotheonellia bacterium]
MKQTTQPAVAPEDILATFSRIKDPDLGRDIVSLRFVKDLRINGEQVAFAIQLTTPACPVRDQMKEQAHRAETANTRIRGHRI